MGDKLLVDKLTELLIQFIIDNNLKTGDKLPNEFELAEILGVGRSTVREAVKILVSRNILEIRRGAGTFVAKEKGVRDDPLGFVFIRDKVALAMDLLDVRMMIEPEIAALAARNATKDQAKKLLLQCSVVEEKIRQNQNHTDDDIHFHRMIARYSGNLAVEKLIPIINSSVIVFINITGGLLRSETIETHQEIAEAIYHNDPESAKSSMLLHLIYNRRWIVKNGLKKADNL